MIHHQKMWLTFLIVIVVDWSGASVTPRGLSGSSDAPWKAHWWSGSQPQVMVKSLVNPELW